MGELDWLLDNLVSSVLGVRIAVILSPDGLSLGRSPGLIANPRFPVREPVSR